jgi:tetratricopeptide (TPR) repeat protein
VGNVYRRQGNLDEAIQYYERRVELEPARTQGLVTLGATYRAVGRYVDAGVVAGELTALGDPRGLNHDFWSYLQGGDTASALALVPQIRAGQGEPGYFDLLQATLRRDEAAAAAVADTIGYDTGGGLRFEQSHLLYRTGQAEAHAGTFEAWIGDVTAALESDTGPTARVLHLESSRRRNLALLEAFRGNEAEARAHAERVLELQPQLADKWGASGHRYDVAITYAALGDNNAALDILESLAQDGFASQTGWLEHHPSLDPLRGEPRFYDLIAARRAVEQPR